MALTILQSSRSHQHIPPNKSQTTLFNSCTRLECVLKTSKFGKETTAYKTWDQFKNDFAESHLKFRDAGGTTAAGATGYQANNDVYQQDTIEAIANLSTATSHDWHPFSILTATYRALTKELTSVNAKLATPLLANTKLTAKIITNPPQPYGTFRHPAPLLLVICLQTNTTAQ